MYGRTKARIQKVCAGIPAGDRLYLQLQRRFGLTADPSRMIDQHVRMLRGLRDVGFSTDGAACVEVGTGHVPLAPLLFYLVGAREVATIDPHRRVLWPVTAEACRLLAEREQQLLAAYHGLADLDRMRTRVAVIRERAGHPESLLGATGVTHLSAADAARMTHPDGSMDLHFSIDTFEHIPPGILRGILAEAHRLTAPTGLLAHLVDPSDHYAHHDERICRVNHLRFTDAESRSIAGNGYCNRMRAPDVLAAFASTGFQIFRVDVQTDAHSLQAVKAGLPIDPAFTRFTPDELCTTRLDAYARPGQA